MDCEKRQKKRTLKTRLRNILCLVIAALMGIWLVPFMTEAQESGAAGSVMVKSETVYAQLSADGSTDSVVVSVWLKNTEGSDTLADRSDLSDITPVDPSVSFRQEGYTLYWDCGGEDVYYQGVSDRALPVDCQISYTLDGQAVSPEELAGKSGHLTMRAEFTNNSYQEVEIGGEQTRLTTPFTLLAYGTLGRGYENLETEGLKSMEQSGTPLVYGYFFPGLRESLNLTEEEADFPEGFTLEADVSDFEMQPLTIVMLPDMMDQVDMGQLEELSGLADSLEETGAASLALADAGAALTQGIASYNSYVGNYVDAMGTFDQGIGTISDTFGEMIDGVGALAEAARQVDDGVGAIASGLRDASDGANELQQGMLDAAETAGDAAAQAEELREQLEELRPLLEALAEDYGSAQAIGQMMDNNQRIIDALGTDSENEDLVQQLEDMNRLLAILKEYAEENGGAEVDLLYGAADAAVEGVEGLADAARYAADKTGELADGLSDAADSTAQLRQGSSALSSGLQEMGGGMAALDGALDAAKDFSSRLVQAGSTLKRGGKELLAGANAFDGGLQEFSEELNDAATQDADKIRDFMERKEALRKLGEEYNNFSGLPEGAEGELRFMSKTAQLEQAPAVEMPQEEPEGKSIFQVIGDFFTDLFT